MWTFQLHQSGVGSAQGCSHRKTRTGVWLALGASRFGSVPTIDANVDALLSSAPTPFIEKAKRLLVHLSSQSGPLGKPFELGSPRLDAMLETLNHNDLTLFTEFFLQQGWLAEITGGQWRLTGQGLMKADEWKQAASSSSQAFVAMWFDPGMNAVWKDGLAKGISAAGYKPLRIDTKEHANKICDEIISEIRRSRFMVADYTGHRGGVYYEAGYAAGRDLPVILTCKKEDMKGLHFDIRQYNCIDWRSPDELAHRLQVRIEAIVGDGPFKAR
jgi:nucleoside 2-deoxyribosyltransferase